MAEATLLGFKITRIDLINAIQESSDFIAAHHAEFNVDYTPDNTQAFAEITVTLEMANHPEDFHLDLSVERIFDLTGVVDTETKKDVHLMCYDILWPIANQFVEQLASNSGLSGIKLKKNSMKREGIHFGGKPNDGKIIDFPEQ